MKRKKIMICSIIIVSITAIVTAYILYEQHFSLTPAEKEKIEIKEKTEEIVDALYDANSTQKDTKKLALDYEVATEFLNFSSRNYANTYVDDDPESSKIKLKRKDELIAFYEGKRKELLELCKKNNEYKIKSINKQGEDYYVDLELQSFDMNLYYGYIADFVLMFLAEDGNAGYDVGVKGEKGRIRVMEDVYIAKAWGAKIFGENLDDFKIKETTSYTIRIVKEKNRWKIDNLNTLQFAFNGGYAKKYTENDTEFLLTQRRFRINELWQKAKDEGVVNKNNIRDVDDILK